MNATDNLRTLDRQIKELSDWLYQTRSVPNYVKAQMAEVRATLKLLWEDIDPSAFGEGMHCGTVALARHDRLSEPSGIVNERHLPPLPEKDKRLLRR